EEEGEEEEEENEGEKEDEDSDDDDDESDKYSDVLEDSESEDEKEPPREKKIVKVVTSKKKEMMEAAKKEIPYTFEVPQDYESFWALLENHSPKETLHVLTDPDGDSPIPGVSPMIYVDSFIQHIFTITQVSPANSAKALMQVLLEKYEECSQSKFKRYPMANTFVFLKIAGILFPSSDYIHPIMTPVMTFLTHLLGQAKVVSQREITAALFSTHLLLEYLSQSKRFVPELTNLLNGLLFIAIGAKKKIHEVLIANLLSVTVEKFSHDFLVYLIEPSLVRQGHSVALNLLQPHEPTLRPHTIQYTESKLTLASINNTEAELTDSFKINILCKTTKLLKQLCNCWSQLPSIRTIMAPTIKLLESLSLKNYPDSVNKTVEELLSAIRSLPIQGQPLVKAEGRPVSIKMYEPAIEEIIEGVKKHHGTKSYLEKQKLTHKLKRERKGARREIQRDTAFLARQQLKEVLLSDVERKRKIGLLMSGLQTQEGNFKRMKNQK
ncbi:Nucleolar protein 14-like 1, partial [Homarus americanus]